MLTDKAQLLSLNYVSTQIEYFKQLRQKSFVHCKQKTTGWRITWKHCHF